MVVVVPVVVLVALVVCMAVDNHLAVLAVDLGL
jgi:hypothetical protein